MSNLIDSLSKNSTFIVIASLASILSFILGIFSRKIYNYVRKNKEKKKKVIKVGTQEIIGKGNRQAFGNINLKKNQSGNSYTKSEVNEDVRIDIDRLSIKGDNNIQSGGDINE